MPAWDVAVKVEVSLLLPEVGVRVLANCNEHGCRMKLIPKALRNHI